jgi:hypothetical protein
MEFPEFLEAVREQLRQQGLWADEQMLQAIAREEWSKKEAMRIRKSLKPSEGGIEQDEQSVTIGGVRIRKKIAIVQTEDRDPVPDLIEALRDSDLEVRKMVIDTLGKIGGADAVSELTKIAQDQNEAKVIRIAAINALGRPGNIGAVSFLQGILEDVRGKKFEDIKGNSCIIVNAGKALREIGTSDAQEVLKEILPHIPSQDMVEKILGKRPPSHRNYWPRPWHRPLSAT